MYIYLSLVFCVQHNYIYIFIYILYVYIYIYIYIHTCLVRLFSILCSAPVVTLSCHVLLDFLWQDRPTQLLLFSNGKQHVPFSLHTIHLCACKYLLFKRYPKWAILEVCVHVHVPTSHGLAGCWLNSQGLSLTFLPDSLIIFVVSKSFFHWVGIQRTLLAVCSWAGVYVHVVLLTHM